MSHRILAAALVVGSVFCAPLVAGGQDRWPVSIEASLGMGDGRTSGEYRDETTGLTGDLLVGVRIRPTEAGAIVGAASFGILGGGWITDDMCYRASDGGCLQRFPQFAILSVLAGWETRTTALRFLSGPSMVRAHGDWNTYRFAWMTRLDAAAPIVARVSGIVSLRGLFVPSYDDDSFQLIGIGVGLRIR